MSVKCGNRQLHGKDVVYHDTVAQVRLCYQGTYGAGVLQKPAEPKPAAAPAQTTLAQAFRQSTQVHEYDPSGASYGLHPVDNDEDFPKPEPPAVRPQTPAEAPPARASAEPRMSKQELRQRLKSIPVGGRGYGYFAYERDGVLKFYRVKSENGFVSLAAQGGPTFYEVNYRLALPILLEIAEDAEAYALRYARELNRCSRCNAMLTDESSRARGMGPDCFGRAG